MTYPIASVSMDRLARLLRTAGPLPAELRYKLDVLENTIAAVGPDPNVACLNALENNARQRVEEIERYLATQAGVVFPTPANDPPTVHLSWNRFKISTKTPVGC